MHLRAYESRYVTARHVGPGFSFYGIRMEVALSQAEVITVCAILCLYCY